MHARTRVNGFTMIEMMVTVSIAAILFAVTVPSFKDASLGSQLRSSADQLMASANLARSEAIKRNAPITLCVSSDGETCGTDGWQQGWVVRSATDVIQSQAKAPSGFLISASGGATSLSFQPTGVGSTVAEFTICRATPNPGNQKRLVKIDAVGRASVEKAAGGACS